MCMCELDWIPNRVWLTAAVFADKMAPSNGCHCHKTGNSGRDPQNLEVLSKVWGEGKNP